MVDGVLIDTQEVALVWIAIGSSVTAGGNQAWSLECGSVDPGQGVGGLFIPWAGEPRVPRRMECCLMHTAKRAIASLGLYRLAGHPRSAGLPRNSAGRGAPGAGPARVDDPPVQDQRRQEVPRIVPRQPLRSALERPGHEGLQGRPFARRSTTPASRSRRRSA